MRAKKGMRTVRDFLRWEPLLSDMVTGSLAKIERPARVMGREVPKDLEELTFEELCRLWAIRTTEDIFVVGSEVILKRGRWRVMRAELVPMMGFANWLAKEVQRIIALWEEMPSSHTPEEVAAGCQRLGFGVFGIVDWYARRMGITNHDEVFATKWVRIYQCMKNDAEERAYRKRLEEIISRKQHK